MNDSIDSCRSLARFFADSVRLYPDRPALSIGERQWTYGALRQECDAIRLRLESIGFAGRQANIGVLSAKTLVSYASIVATMESGNVYVPLNPRFPVDRLLKIVEDAGIETVIVDAASVDAAIPLLKEAGFHHVILPDSGGNPVPDLDRASTRIHWGKQAAGLPDGRGDVPISRPARFAYMMYTSGSTGGPKGVAVTHDNGCACIERAFDLFETDCADRFTQMFELSFDLSICDIFLCWRSGGCLFVPQPQDRLIPLDFVRRNEISVWGAVPSLASNMQKLNLLKNGTFPSLRLSWFCGEAFPAELAQAWSEAAPLSKIYNVYGPTETTIFVTSYLYEPGKSPATGIVPIGDMLPGLDCLVIDDGQPTAGAGELWLSGDQVVPGYWNKPDTTAASFVKRPGSDRIWYRTGDLASIDGRFGLMFHGRIDRQVKMRGNRVELQEIEGAIRRTVGCATVAVIPVFSKEGICTHLVAFCDRIEGGEAAAKKASARELPPYMIPEKFIEIDRFPYNSNGKLDYKELSGRIADPQSPSA